MLCVVQYQMSRRLTCTIMSLRSGLSLWKLIFALLLVRLAVSSLNHYNVISSWINGRFTCIITSNLNVFSAFSILGEGDYMWPKAKSRSWTLRCIWYKWRWQKVTSLLDACLHTTSGTGGLRHTLHFHKVIMGDFIWYQSTYISN